MAVQFILGRAGSGKTHCCLEAVRTELRQSPRGPALVMLVPEQATYQTERALVTTPGLGGYWRALVLSFRRLAYQVLLETGGPTLPPLEAAGKQMVLRSILRQRGDDLRLFGQSARQRGFIERLAVTLGELRSYGHWAERLRAELARLGTRGEGDTLLAAKIHDLAIVIEEYEKFLAGRYVDPDCHLDVVAGLLANKNRFHGARVWVDGFASLTGQEERLLAALMRVAAETKIALCLDPQMRGERQEARGENEDSDLSMFALLRETHQRLTEMARADGHRILPPLLLPEPDQPTRFSRTPALAHLEQHLFTPAPPNQHSASLESERNSQFEIPNPKSVVLTAAADQRCEVRDAACEILRLCREEGFRFREIALVTRDLTPYRALIETVFNDYEIPHFLDVRRDVAHHPLVELVRSALAVVARRWSSQEIIRYAKTDLVALDRAAVDQLENYVVAHGIEGDAWHSGEPWRFHRRYSLGEETEIVEEKIVLQQINAWRDSLVGPLRRFDKAARRENATLLDISRALYGLLEDLAVADRLEQWAGEAEREGRLADADEHRQVWDAVVSLLDQAVSALGRETVSLDEYREIIEAGLEGIRLRMVPPALDQVLVGSIERSRHPEIRAAFVLGMNERVFPMPQTQDVIFGDRERDLLERDGLKLGPVSEKRLLHEQFLAYIAFTRASERLYVSYANADPMGKVLHPSPYLDDLKRCFGNLAERRVEREEPLDRVAHWRAALAGLAAGLRPGEARGHRQDASSTERATWMALYGEMRRDGRLCEALARRVGGLAYENRARLSKPVAQRLYGGRNESSVSRLECFAACPFKHFARYGLALEERLRFRLEHFDLGLLYHAVLKDVYERLSQGKPLDWGRVGLDRAVAAVEEAVERLAPQLRDEILLSSGRHRYLLDAARAALTTFVHVLVASSQRDGFSQAAAEVGFGLGEGNRYGPLEIVLDEGERLLLRGRIDRIDVGRSDPQVVRIVDYKSHTRQFQPNELAHGLTLQLPAYLLAVERGAAGRGKRPTVAGALYIPILRGVSSVAPGEVASDEAAETVDLKAWKARGLFDFRWAALFDADVAAAGGWSPVVALGVKKKSLEPYDWNSHDALAPGMLEELLRWTERKIAEFGRAILSGDIAVSPYLLGNLRPCTWCEFRSVCRFDGRREPYRRLASRRRAEAIQWIQEQLRG
jgi:ATP-dependent helicase/nuclease subunit B